VALGVGGTIGGGIYVLVGRAAADAGPGALLSFGVAFAAALLIALPYAELACRYPLTGGGYAFVRTVFGSRAGFMMGWGFWGAYLLMSGYVTLGFGGYLHAVTGVPVLAGAICLITVVLVVNLLGVRLAGAVQATGVCVAIAGLLAVTCWGLPHLTARHFQPFLPHGVGGVLSASLFAFLAFGGFDMVAAAGEEIRHPERNLPRAILLTLAAVLGTYLLVCLVAIGVAGAGALAGSRAPLAYAAQVIGGAPLRQALTLVALLTTAATANAVLIVTSRISFAMARDGLLPRRLAALGGRTRAPWAAVVLSAGLLAVVAATGSIAFAAAAGGFLYVLHFVAMLFALVALRRRGHLDARPGVMRTPAPRITVSLALVACAGLLVAGGWIAASGAAVWLALGAIGHGTTELRQRRQGRG
jgi:APA family basic amino acid/polyamine antiporter